MEHAVVKPPGVWRYRWIAASLLVIALITWFNRFPEGVIFAGGDIFQVFDRAFVERNFRHIWANLVGEGDYSSVFLYYPFYVVVLAVSDLLGFGTSQQLMLYMLIFLGGGYLSCLFAFSILPDARFDPSSLEANLLALFYAVNPFTFYAFFFVWGYSPFLFLYVLIPVITTLTLRFFWEPSWVRATTFLAALFFAHLCASVAYANLPFFVALNFALGCLVLFEWFLGPRRDLKKLVVKGMAFVAVEVAATCWAVVPQIPHLLFEKYPVSSSAFADWILWQRIPLWEVFTFNPNTSYWLEKSRAAVLSLVPLGAMLWVLTGPQESRTFRGRAIAAAMVAAAIFFIESKGKGVVPGSVAVWVFSNPVLGAMRSMGKATIFGPFLVLLLVWYATSGRPRRTRLALLWVLIASSAITAYPMVLGQLQTKSSIGLAEGKDCSTSEYCYLVRIPPEYAAASAAIDRDGLGGKIYSLPYSVLNSYGWSNHPSWKLVANDPTVQLFSLPVVQMNTFHLWGQKPYGEEWVKRGGVDPAWLMDLAADLGVSYFLFHKDVHPNFVQPPAQYLREYEAKGLIRFLYDSPVVSVYRVSDTYLRPVLTAGRSIDVTKVAPTKYVATLSLDAKETNLVLREGFSGLWRVHVLPASRVGPARQVAEGLSWWESFRIPTLPRDSQSRFGGYGNSWRIDTAMVCRDFGCVKDEKGAPIVSLVVEYAPQRLVYLLQAVTATCGIAALVMLVVFRVNARRWREGRKDS